MQGEWYILQGAFGIQTHQTMWAYDLVIRDEIGLLARVPNSTRNEDYYDWGRPVAAPVQARVVLARRDDPDNTPGTPGTADGNAVGLDIGGIGLLFNHFQRGSVAVSNGEAVVPGKLLGLVGNSGRSGLPHVHIQFYQLTNTANTLPMALSNVRVSLNLGNDPWSRDLARWEPREGFFVERVSQ